MRLSMGKLIGALLAVATLAACGEDQPVLMNVRSTGDGPDEFAIVPNKPLQAPEDFAALPPPTPGGANRVDATPEADAIAALGGNPAAVARAASPTEGALIQYASRFGRDATIRQRLAAEDLEYRRRKDGRLLERLANVNVYYRAYEPLSLDQYAELERFRRIGVRTPSAPPAPRE
ncbi:DUF3035 domain-containing protein [Anianabacter salinae]|uniref:DUF3035 domain-containing protein n=1 Tax=Anianabacter salinae TaxID=2851023 RepID=UPI00225E1A8F|nr:DUF3035 domain-containing protein [Anianabacter salinae]MBV0913372.1 DUF3035 domain-containing protein [Anianabacter salinae]